MRGSARARGIRPERCLYRAISAQAAAPVSSTQRRSRFMTLRMMRWRQWSSATTTVRTRRSTARKGCDTVLMNAKQKCESCNAFAFFSCCDAGLYAEDLKSVALVERGLRTGDAYAAVFRESSEGFFPLQKLCRCCLKYLASDPDAVFIREA